MLALITASGLLLMAFGVHVAIWHFRRPRNHTLGLLCIFGAFYPVGLVLALLCPITAEVPTNPWSLLLVTINYFVLAVAYIAFYSILEENSPSLEIVKMVFHSGADGLGKEDIRARLQAEDILKSRIAASVKGGLIEELGGRYFLTNKGYTLARLFALAARLMGLKGGG